MTSCGERIQQLRAQFNLSQAELAKRTGMDQGNLSRIESGKHANPSDETLRKVVEGLLNSREAEAVDPLLRELTELRDAAAAAHVSAGREWRIGFAHCLWAAPFVGLRSEYEKPRTHPTVPSADGDSPAHIRLTSRANPQNGLPVKVRWDFREAVDVARNEAPQKDEDLRRDGATANELIALLHRGELDAIVVAREVAEENRKLLVPCAEVLHSVGGSLMLLVVDREKLGKRSNSRDKDARVDVTASPTLRELWDVILKHPASRELPTLFAPRTNSELYANWLKAWLKTNAPTGVRHQDTVASLRLDPVPVTPGQWKEVEDSAAHELSEAGYLAFVAWDPHVDWLRRKFAGNPQYAIAVGYAHELGGAGVPLPYVSFTLCIRADVARKAVTDRAFLAFLKQLEEQCAWMGRKEATRRPFGIVEQIATYFNMEATRCEEELDALEFRVRYESAWVDMMRDHMPALSSHRGGQR